jgi:hypothetical protein
VQKVEFGINFQTGRMTFTHFFHVCPIEMCGDGILGLDFLQRVGVGISLTGNLLTIRDRHKSLSSASLKVAKSLVPEAAQTTPHGLATREEGSVADLGNGWPDEES